MKTINAKVCVGLVGCVRDFSFLVEEDATDDEIDEALSEEVWNIITVWIDND